MNVLETILGPDNKGMLKELTDQFGLTDDQTRSALENLVPPLSRGLQKNTGNTPGLDELLDALESGNHGRYVESPDILRKTETRDDGNDILGHIFGNKEVSRKVANQASVTSGISSALLKKMLPVVATIVMGTMSKKILGGGSRANRADAGGLIGNLLDMDNDGSYWDDILSIGAKALIR